MIFVCQWPLSSAKKHAARFRTLSTFSVLNTDRFLAALLRQLVMSNLTLLQRSTSRTETIPPPTPPPPTLRPGQSYQLTVGRYAQAPLQASMESVPPAQFTFAPRQEDPGLLAAILPIARQLTLSPQEAEGLSRRLGAVQFSASSIEHLMATDEGRERLLALIDVIQKCTRFLSARHSRVLVRCSALETAVTAAEQAVEVLRGERDRIAQAYEEGRGSGNFRMPAARGAVRDSFSRHDHASRAAAEGAQAAVGAEDLRASQANVFLDVGGLAARAAADDVASSNAVDLLKALRGDLVNGVVAPAQLSSASPVALTNTLNLLVLLLQYTAWKLEFSTQRSQRLEDRHSRRSARVTELKGRIDQLREMMERAAAKSGFKAGPATPALAPVSARLLSNEPRAQRREEPISASPMPSSSSRPAEAIRKPAAVPDPRGASLDAPTSTRDSQSSSPSLCVVFA